jgi:hypothetical protein
MILSCHLTDLSLEDDGCGSHLSSTHSNLSTYSSQQLARESVGRAELPAEPLKKKCFWKNRKPSSHRLTLSSSLEKSQHLFLVPKYRHHSTPEKLDGEASAARAGSIGKTLLLKERRRVSKQKLPVNMLAQEDAIASELSCSQAIRNKVFGKGRPK